MVWSPQGLGPSTSVPRGRAETNHHSPFPGGHWNLSKDSLRTIPLMNARATREKTLDVVSLQAIISICMQSSAFLVNSSNVLKSAIDNSVPRGVSLGFRAVTLVSGGRVHRPDFGPRLVKRRASRPTYLSKPQPTEPSIITPLFFSIFRGQVFLKVWRTAHEKGHPSPGTCL